MPDTETEVDALKEELMGLLHYVQRVRQEIAAIHRPPDEDHQFDTMSDQLDAIVAATEKATNMIMECVEQSLDGLTELRGTVRSKKQHQLIDDMVENANRVFEACSFQDITGQRVTKVMKSLTYVEARVTNLIDIWGKDELDKVEVLPDHEKTEDEKLLAGPQFEGQGISQDEIDKLFD